MKILQEIRDDKKGRTYKVIQTDAGKMVFFEFGECVQYRNLTTQDFAWTICRRDEFILRFCISSPIEIFASERLSGFEKAIKVQFGNGKKRSQAFNLFRKKKYDGCIYAVSSTYLRIFPKKDYPNKKFVYFKFFEPTLKAINPIVAQNLLYKEIQRFDKAVNLEIDPELENVLDHVLRMIKNESKSFDLSTNFEFEPLELPENLPPTTSNDTVIATEQLSLF